MRTEPVVVENLFHCKKRRFKNQQSLAKNKNIRFKQDKQRAVLPCEQLDLNVNP
jgi:hypothetical protein